MTRTLEEVLNEASKDRRVCPQPPHWHHLWKLLPDRRQQGAGWRPPLPLILAAWWETSDEQKRQRFHDHIRWAEQHGALDRVAELIFNLAPDDWHTEE